MIKSITILIVIIGLLLSSCQQDNDNARKEELKNVVINYFKALSEKDLQKANSLTTNNMILFDEGLIFNNAVAIDSVKKMKPFTPEFKIDSLNVHVDKKDASAYYFREAVFKFTDTVIHMHFLESCTFNKVDGKWKLRFLHSTIRK